jgi:DNA polymerase I - 3''-5'' exonuclease and polymerase domains
LVETTEEANDFLRWLSQDRNVLAIDTETGGLSYHKDPLRLVQFGDTSEGWSLSYKDWRGVIKIALERYEGPVVLHNHSFDYHFLTQNGLPLPKGRTHDSMLMSHLLEPNQAMGLKAAARRHVDPQAADGQQLLKQAFRQYGWTWATVPENYGPYFSYACLDTVLTACLAEKLLPQIQSLGLEPSYDLEMEYSEIMRAVETRGIRLDIEYTQKLKDTWHDELIEIQDDLIESGITNPGSDHQISTVFCELGWNPTQFTPTGRPKMDESVLSQMENPLAKMILRYRRLVKWTSGYLDNFLNLQHDGRIHPTIRTYQARTGRSSVTSPALQTLPRGDTIRNCLIPEDGHSFISTDFNQVEMRIFAHFSQEHEMLKRINDGMNVHAATAEALYGPEFTSDQQQIAKNGNFAKVYGAGIGKFAATAKVSLDEAQAFDLAYNQRFPGVARFSQQVIDLGRSRYNMEGLAYVRTPLGRRLVADPKKVYSLVNYLIQGTASEVFKQKICYLSRAGFEDNLRLVVHDEGLFDVPDEDCEEASKAIAEIMTDTDSFAVPLTVSSSPPAKRWGGK